jgi:hypothetical protein
VQLDDSEDPQPHLTAMTQVLGFSSGPVSIVLVEIQGVARYLREQSEASPEPNELERLLVEVLQESVCLQASKVLRDFRAERIQKMHHHSTMWLEGGDRHVTPSRGAQTAAISGSDTNADPLEPDVHELARLLDEATDVVAICQHFLASLQAPGDLAFDQQAVADLPLFADVLSLTAQYVDLETVYCLLNLSKVILDTAPMAVTAEVSSNRVETFVVAQPAAYYH